MRSNQRREREELQLAIVRFRKLFEDARQLSELVADAREKAQGDFIFDRQYIVALVDEAVALAGQLLFHSYVLAPGKSGAVERMHSGIRGGGRALLARPAGIGAVNEAAGADEPPLGKLPEFRLLSDTIAWLDGPVPVGDCSALQFVDAVFDLAAESLDTLIDLNLKVDGRLRLGTGAAGAIDIIDFGHRGRGGTSGGTHLAATVDGPLKLISLGAGRAEDSGGTGRARGGIGKRTWLAAIDAGRFSLFGGPGPARIHVEAALTGDPAGDYLFIGGTDAGDPGSIVHDAMTLRRTPRGFLAWMQGVRTRDLEDGLVRFGQEMFGGAA